MDHLLSNIEFSDITASSQNDVLGSALTGDNLLSLILLLIFVILSLLVTVFIVKSKSKTSCANTGLSKNCHVGLKSSAFYETGKYCIAVATVVAFITGIVFACFLVNNNFAQANADSNTITITPTLKAETNGDITNVTEGTITNNSNYNYILYELNLRNDNEQQNIGNWQIKVGENLQNLGFNQTTKLEHPQKIAPGQQVNFTLNTDIKHEQTAEIVGQIPYTLDIGAVQIAQVSEIKINDKTQPNDVASTDLKFSWKINATAKGVAQSAYQILVSDSSGKQIYDSGKIASSDNNGVKAQIPSLKDSSKYTCNIAAWDQYGNQLDSTNAASNFETALLGDNPMASAQYLSFNDTRLTDTNDRATKNFTIDYDIIIKTNENKTCFGLENSKNFTYVHLLNKTDDTQTTDEFKVALGQQVGGSNAETEAAIFSDISFKNQIADKITHVKITAVSDGTDGQKITVTVTPEGQEVTGSKSQTFSLSSATTIKPTELKKLGMYNDVHKQVTNVQGNSDYSYRSLLTNIVAQNTDALQNSTTAQKDASTKSEENTQNLDVAQNTTTQTQAQNDTKVYENNFGNGKLGFYHEYSAHIVEQDDRNWIEVGFSTPDSNWGNEPLCEYYNDEGNFPAFRHALDVNKKIASAKLYTTGLGAYDCFINGQRVYNNTASGPEYYELKNNYTEYQYTQYYLTFDVTPMLSTGKNVLAAITSDSWWSDKITNHWGLEDAFKCQLDITYTDGTQQTITTDPTSWKTSAASPMYKAEMFSGEAYDARTNLEWMQPTFDDAQWVAPKTNNEFSGTTAKLSAWAGDKIVVRQDLQHSPIKTQLYSGSTGAVPGERFGNIVVDKEVTGNSFTLNKGQTAIIDFGQILSGWENLTISGSAGTMVTIRHAEIINEADGVISRANFGPGGSANYYNLRSCQATTNYVCGGATQNYHPSLTYYGFRYIEITATDAVTISDISASTVTSVNTDTGNITTSNSKINQLISNGKWGMYDNYLGVPTDCPQRDERQGWTADTQIFAETGMYLGSNKGFLEKFCRDMRDAQARKAATASEKDKWVLPATAPASGWGGNAWGATGWADAGVIIPYTLYEMYGDTQILQDSWESMHNYVWTWIPTNDSDDAQKFHRGPTTMLGDWHVPDQEHLNREEIKNVIACEYYLWDLQIMCKTARVLGKDDSTIKQYDDKYNEILAWFTSHFYSEESGLIYPESQTIAAYALFLDILPGDTAKQKTADLLCNNIAEFGNKLKTGFLGTRVLLDALVKCGHADLAYTVLKSEGNPSWLLSVNNGATTFWERWDSYTKENGYFNKDGKIDYTNSLNHYSYGSVCGWMYKNMLGINNDGNAYTSSASDTSNTQNAAGFKHINLTPYPCTDNTGEIDLSHVWGSYESAAGTISADSNYSAEKWTYAFITPANTTTTLTVPKLGFSNFSINGKNIYDLTLDYDGAQLVTQTDTTLTINITSGSFVLIEQ